MQALSAYGSAYGAGQVSVDQAIMNMGQANDAGGTGPAADLAEPPGPARGHHRIGLTKRSPRSGQGPGV